jgi:hypothetical protein
MRPLTYFLARRRPDFVENADDDEEGKVVLDGFHPAGFVRIDPDAPLVKFHLL